MDPACSAGVQFLNLSVLWQLLKYGLVGVVSLGVDVTTFIFMRMVGCDLLPANVLSRFVGAMTALLGNSIWTFPRHLVVQTASRRLIRYCIQWIVATVTSTLLLSILIASSGNDIMIKIAVEVLIMGVNFLIAKYWVFS